MPVIKPCDFFGLVAQKYDRPPHRWFYRRIASELIGAIPGNAPIDSILEVGAGTGFSTCLLEESFPDARITALEPSREMSLRGQRKTANVAWVNKPLLELDDAGFDLVFSSMSYHWLDESEREKLVELAEGGVLALALPVTGGPCLQGNQELRILARKLRAAAGWPRHIRRPDAMREYLGERFHDVSCRRLGIDEEYEHAKALAKNLYVRGALHALFAEDAERARVLLAGAKNGRIGFNWEIGLFLAA